MKLGKKLITEFLLIICLVSFALFIFSFNGVKVGAYTEIPFSLNTIQDEYSINDLLTIEGQLEYDNAQYDITKAELEYPNGEVYAKKEFTLSQLGEYNLTLYSEKDGVSLKTIKKIKVTNAIFSTTSESSFSEYRENIILKGKDISDVAFQTQLDGIYTKINGFDVFTYNQPIKLNKGETEIVSFFHNNYNRFVDENGEYIGTPKSLLQAQNMHFRLTDCYDSDKYLEFVLYSNGMLYYRAQASGQNSIGISDDYNSKYSNSVVIDGKIHTYFIDSWGCGSSHNGFQSNNSSVSYKLLYNPQTNRCFVEDSNGKHMINDLSNTDIHKTPFEGFTTNEVYLTIFGSDYQQTNYFELYIESINGLYGKDMLPDTFDNTAPNIVIDAPNLDNIYIAKGEELVLFDAKSYDVNSNNVVNARVYYNYGAKEKQVLVYSKDGKFTPDKVGEYTIEYSSEDFFGNKTIKTVVVNSIDAENNKSLNFTVEKLTKIYAGKITNLPDYQTSGLNGQVNVETYYEYEGERQSFNQNFIPKAVGEYIIVYRYFDELKSEEYSYTVNCEPSDGILPVAIPALPKYLIKGLDYTFEPMSVNTFDKSEVETLVTDVYLSKNGSEYEKIDYLKYKIDFNGEVKLKYVYKEWSYETDVLKILDVGYGNSLSMKDYFIGDVETSSDFDGVLIESNKTDGDVKIEFANLILLSNFKIGFTIPQGLSNFNELVITLTDSQSNSLNIIYANVGGYAQVAVTSNGRDFKFTGLGSSFADMLRIFTYNAKEKNFLETSGVNLNTDIELFTDKVNLSITLKGINGNAGLKISDICNQTFSNVEQDYIKPILSVNVTSGTKALNDKIVFEPIACADVLSTVINENTKLFVKQPDGQFAKDANGITLNGAPVMLNSYTLVLSQYGSYKCYFEIKDGNGKKTTSETYEISVVDNEKPIITINGINDERVIEAKINQGYRLLGYSATDNATVSENLKIVRVAVTPTGEMIRIETSDKFIYLDRLGDWEIKYYCYDTDGNYSCVSYVVKVSAEK